MPLSASVASIFIVNVTSFASLAALEALADALAALLASLEADELAALLLTAALEALAELAEELAAELDACWPQPTSTTESASANTTASSENSFELWFITFPLMVKPSLHAYVCLHVVRIIDHHCIPLSVGYNPDAD